VIPPNTSIQVLRHYSNDSANAEWLAMCRSMETEGSTTPAQAGIEIRADFPRKAFCLYRNGEAVGVSSQYKAVWLARQFLLGELAQVQP
jgi:hypothetical protein